MIKTPAVLCRRGTILCAFNSKGQGVNVKLRMLIVTFAILFCALVGCVKHEQLEGAVQEKMNQDVSDETIITTLTEELATQPSVREEEMNSEETVGVIGEGNSSEHIHSSVLPDTPTSETQVILEEENEEQQASNSEIGIAPNDSDMGRDFGNGPNDTPDQEL